ncbi:hypothetical protein [Polynucleobacter necessarius]|uniref:hypothetical protein n=1 Tax=Polynucleobacter necessarius TaxID=576610 RepID=UPI0018D50AA1|nr:hypothetical protein [Polynucleobacter necessarius]
MPTLDQHLFHRLRLELSASGELSVANAVIHETQEPVKIFWARDILAGDVTMFSGNGLLRHKTSNRSIYDQA